MSVDTAKLLRQGYERRQRKEQIQKAFLDLCLWVLDRPVRIAKQNAETVKTAITQLGHKDVHPSICVDRKCEYPVTLYTGLSALKHQPLPDNLGDHFEVEARGHHISLRKYSWNGRHDVRDPQILARGTRNIIRYLGAHFTHS